MKTISTSISINYDLFILVLELFGTLEFHNMFELKSLDLKEYFILEYQAYCEPLAKPASNGWKNIDSTEEAWYEPVWFHLLVSVLWAAMLERI